jgi:hypothetical protein
MRLQAIEQEVLIRKRLRPLIAELRAQAADYASTRGLSADERASVMIKAFMNANGFEFSDLVALRERPYFWDMHHAEQWNWLLHRVMNTWRAA